MGRECVIGAQYVAPALISPICTTSLTIFAPSVLKVVRFPSSGSIQSAHKRHSRRLWNRPSYSLPGVGFYSMLERVGMFSPRSSSRLLSEYSADLNITVRFRLLILYLISQTNQGAVLSARIITIFLHHLVFQHTALCVP